MCLNSTFFRYSARSPHRATKPSRGWLRVVVRKLRLVLFELDRAGNKVTARARAYCRGCMYAASRHQERTRTRRTKAQRDSAPLRTAKHSAGLVKQPEKLLLGATQARRSRIDRHRLAASTITSTKSRRLQKTASEVEPSAQSDESTAFR